MLIDNIKKDNIEALKNKDSNKRAILSVVINKYMALEIANRQKGKEVVDTDVISLIQKTIKELDEEIENFKKVNNLEKVALLEKQKEDIQKYLPKMLTEEEIKKIILSLEDKSIPSVMKHFKEHYLGQCDMSKVSAIARNI